MFKRIVIGTIIVVIIIGWWWRFWCGVETVVVLIRHSDRVQGQDQLSDIGLVRSQELVHVLEKAGVDAIIRSDTNRTAQTAAPLAAATGITPVVFPPNNIAAFVDEIRSHSGETVFVIGHSNTVPQIIATLGGPGIPEIAETEFDNLFVLTLCRCSWRPARLLNLQYGAPSP